MPLFRLRSARIALVLLPYLALSLALQAQDLVATAAGKVEGTTSADGKIKMFRGIPFAAPPVGDLRWKAPQPVKPWNGTRKADAFGAACMQTNVFGDMVFHDNGPSEDCLYLNVWTPNVSAKAHLPVMFWIYGGGFVAGASSEGRQNGEFLAHKGVVVVSFNYRLGVFGFLAHPELTKESANHASGNYGLLDQVAALEWVKKNIEAFGGDPKNITIFGESAGSFSVSALMASPLSRDLFQKAIGESGAFFGTSLRVKPLDEAEQIGTHFAESAGASNLAALRSKSTDEILTAYKKGSPFAFPQDIDGYFFPEDPRKTFADGKQARVPLLAGWNRDEGSYHAFFAKEEATAANYATIAKSRFGEKASEFLKLYPGSTDEEAKRSAQDFAGDQFIAYSTWKWLEMQSLTAKVPVFRYEFDNALPRAPGDKNPDPPSAYHSAEIEFVFEALASKPLPWRPEDEKLSDLMSTYWSNFAKKADPNGPALPHWPAYAAVDGYQVMHLSFESKSSPDTHRARYQFFETLPPPQQ